LKFIVDECVGPGVAKWLKEQGYEVFSVFDELRGASDNEIIEKAQKENWILITADKDFGTKVYREHKLHKGVILLRLEDLSVSNKIEVLKKLLTSYANKLSEKFVVVTEKKIRFR